MSTLFPRSYTAAAAIAAVPLLFCSLVPWFARADAASSPAVGVVDALLTARVARDVNAVAALFDVDARIVDSSRDRVTGTEGFSQLLPLGETIEFGPRNLEEAGEVTWTETVVQAGRPSWENNLNWWMDDNAAVGVQLSTPAIGQALLSSRPQTSASTPAAPSDTRTMRAIVTQARISRLTMIRAAPLEAGISVSSAVAQTARMLALATTLALLGSVLVEIVASKPTARPPSNRGWLVQELAGWLAVRRGRGPC